MSTRSATVELKSLPGHKQQRMEENDEEECENVGSKSEDRKSDLRDRRAGRKARTRGEGGPQSEFAIHDGRGAGRFRQQPIATLRSYHPSPIDQTRCSFSVLYSLLALASPPSFISLYFCFSRL